VIDVSEWLVVRDEPLGASEKCWLRDPSDSDPTRGLWLFKPVVVHDNGHSQRGDHSERIAEGVAGLVGVPTAETRLALRHKRYGTLSRNVRPGVEWDMYTGGLWLINAVDLPFAGRDSREKSPSTPGYTLDAIQLVLQDTGCPPSSSPELQPFSGWDVFIGMLILDGLISNRDRHEQNWSILRPSLGDDTTRLAPAYDNESSLGFNLTDDRRARILQTPSMLDAYRRRATAWRFDWGSQQIPSLIDLASMAATRTTSSVRKHWGEKLSAIKDGDFETIVSGVYGMSDVAHRFSVNLMQENLKEMRNAIRD